MVSFSVLPGPLLALLLALPVFAEPRSPNDPFRAIALYVFRPPDAPICCLKPVPPAEPVEDELLLSFEDWKAKQFQQAKDKDSDNWSIPSGNGGHGGSGGGSTVQEPKPSETSVETQPSALAQEVPDNSSPHFRVPLTDRFNYASLDCSARVHTSHRSAKSPSSILSSKKDKYMLSPCASSKQERQYVVVELCEDIRIDTVQLANFEFFSGVFKDFTVSVAKTYTTDEEGWSVAGTYTAKNVRGVQSFHPPTSLRDFYRYLRIDFHSHYSNEYYCPVSLLRVYGLTHLEQWKWDMWEAESRAKRDEVPAIAVAGIPAAVPAEVAAEAPKPADTPAMVKGNVDPVMDLPMVTPQDGPPSKDAATDPSTSESVTSEKSARQYFPGSDMTASNSPSTSSSGAVVQDRVTSSVGATVVESIPAPVPLDSGQVPPSTAPSTSTSTEPHVEPKTVNSTPLSDPTHEATSQPSSSPSFSISKATVASTSIHDMPSASSVDPPSHSASPPIESFSSSPPTPSTNFMSSIISTITSTTNTLVSNNTTVRLPSISSLPPVVPLPPPPATTGGESIYRTIMNRLTALEANHTLYARYVEEQAVVVREVLRRVGEDVGRLEGIGKTQAQMYQRTVQEWERRRDMFEMEYGELVSRVNYLADEVVLEKRLGIAQLCLLLTVLVFMGLTRGSRGGALISLDRGIQPAFKKSMREWGRRNLSFSGDWVSRFRSRSPTPTGVGKAMGRGQENVTAVKVEFPSQSPVLGDPLELKSSKRHSGQDMGTAKLRLPSRSPVLPEAEFNPNLPGSVPRSAGAVMMTMSTSAGPKPRSSTPSTLRTPARSLNIFLTPTAGGRQQQQQHHQHQHQHHHSPATSSARVRPHFYRAQSAGLSVDVGSPYGTGFGFGTPGPLPRSAKKWARSAHLHEVRGKSGKQRRGDEERALRERGRPRDKENEIVDVFGGPGVFHGGDTAEKGVDLNKGKSSLHVPQPFGFSRHSDGDDSASTSGDHWVDTDVDGSEAESELSFAARTSPVISVEA